MNTLRIAWRNIWRSKRRTAITVAAVALNTAILIASYGLMHGMIVDTVRNVTHLVVGDAQLHAPGYRSDHSMYKDIPEPDEIVEAALKKGIKAAPRSYGFGLVASGSKSAGAKFWGVNPVLESEAFSLAAEVAKGKFLDDTRPEAPEGQPPERQVVLGRKLAKSLHAGIGSEIVAVVQAADGSLGNELFRVEGVLKTAGEEIDRSAAIIHKNDFEDLFVSGGRVHEIAFNAKGKMTPEQVVSALSDVAGDMELLTWKEIIPALGEMVKMFDAAIWIFGLIFFLAAGLGVMNTMLMATYERIREFGMLKAIGATPWRIVRDVSSEAFMLAVLSTAIGAVVGLIGDVYLHFWGIDLSGLGGDITMTGVAFNPVWRATITAKGLFMPVVVMWVVCVLATLWPAVKAARLDPVKAITHV